MARSFVPRACALLAAAAASATIAPAPAVAASAGWAKTDAILGGTPSALEAILAQQKAPRAAPAALQPASYSALPVMQAVIRQTPAGSPEAFSGRLDVFGSVALPVGPTRLNARWRRAEEAALGGAAADYARSLRRLDTVDRLETVNRYVNNRVRFVDDQVQYGRADVWQAASDTLRRGRGDCEDFAIAKLQMLRSAGVSDRDLYLVIVKDLVSRADHAVLVVRAAGRMYVLDNGTSRLLDSESIRDYRPVLTFAAGGTWTHGYRVRSTPVEIASADRPVAAPLAPAAENQRSWRASFLAFNTGFSK